MKRRKTQRTVTLKDDWRSFFRSHWIAVEWFRRLDEEHLPYPVRPIRRWGCDRCGSDQDDFTLWYTEGRGMGPICKVCWEELGTTEARMPWYRAVWLHWEMGRLEDGCPYGSHTFGHRPFEVGHYHPEWKDIRRAVDTA